MNAVLRLFPYYGDLRQMHSALAGIKDTDKVAAYAKLAVVWQPRALSLPRRADVSL